MITFETENVELPSIDFKKIEIWLEMVASGYDKQIGNLNYLFCDDKKILKINNQFLGHNYFTDIITFDYTRKKRVGGDIYISLDTVKSNAIDLGESIHEELYRVIVHGLLHLCGIDDKGPGEREIMERHENNALSILRNL